MLRDKFAQYFRRGVVKFTYKEQPIHLDIRRVLVYPQAYAAVIPQSGKLLKTPRVFIVDIGGFTTDVLLLRSGKPDLQFCRSLESGVITMDNEIIGKINAQYDRMVDDELISDVLMGRETTSPGGQADHPGGGEDSRQRHPGPAAGAGSGLAHKSRHFHRRR